MTLWLDIGFLLGLVAGVVWTILVLRLWMWDIIKGRTKPPWVSQ